MKTSFTFVASLMLSSVAFGQGFKTSEFSYLTPAPGADFSYEPIVTVGDRVPLTGDAAKEFAFVGIPDAMGIYKDAVSNQNILFVAHEVSNTTISEPIVGESKFKGAFVSRYVLANDGGILSGAPAHQKLFVENTLFSDTPPGADVFTFTGTTTLGSNQITGVAGDLASLAVDMVISGTGIPVGAFGPSVTISSIDLVTNVITMSANATATGATTATTGPRSFTRFCSGSFAGRAQGLDRPMFLTNEETFGSASFETTKGSQTVVIANGNMYTAPDLGRIGRETTLIQPRRDSLTVAISTEDAGSPSYVYMYVGRKNMRSKSPLDRNGLTNGKVYVLCGRDAQHNEGTFTTGSLPTKWVQIPNGSNLTDAELLTAADAAGAFGFVRVEDSEFDPANPSRKLFLATTGGSGPNRLGRLYELSMNAKNPVANGVLTVVYNADLIITPGGSFSGTIGKLVAANGITGSLGAYTGGNIDNGVDFPVSIDNIAISKDFIMIQEDRNSPADAVFAKYARNGGIWSLDRNNNNAAKLQSTFNFAGVEARDAHSAITNRGLWESSGIIRSDEIFGPGTFVVNVQAHRTNVTANGGGTVTSIRTNIPKPGGGTYTRTEAVSLFAEDGQVLIMRPAAE